MWLRPIFIISMALSLLIIGTLVYGAFSWQNKTDTLHQQILSSQIKPRPTHFTKGELEGLPKVVQNYFNKALKEGQPIISNVKLSQKGFFRMDASEDSWKNFKADQVFSTRPIAFDWSARIKLAPGINAYVHDSYFQQRGHLKASLFGAFTVSEAKNDPQITHGELLRYLAEAVWFPTALLPSQGVRWEELNATSARATLQDGMTTVSLDFHFSKEGLVSSVYTDKRYQELNGEYVAVPWQGRFANYVEKNEMLIPSKGEVEWILPQGPMLYWRGEIVDISYDGIKTLN
ncbi:MAG: hypothetical protein K0U47_01520 [Epsilonproteobacteria bacterium]|nr:hypothetical protein [Campylobacterota bacterium]